MKTLIRIIQDQLNLHPANASPLDSQILGEFPAHGARSGRICLFAHFDPQGIIEPYVAQYVKALTGLGFEILFVTTSPCFTSEQAMKLSNDCSRIVHRKNDALDFGSWRVAVHLLAERIETCDQLVLANDSVYGPLFDLREVFGAMARTDAQLWGITDNYQIAYHLQSYFLVFEKPLINSGFVQSFWNDFRFHWSKNRIIRKYEVGLSRRALKHGIPIRALIPATKGDARNRTLLNWDSLIEAHRMPFLKTDCMKLNRSHSPAIRRWKQVLKTSGSTFDPELIERHINRVGMALELR